MKDYIEERVLELANHIIETGATVRSTAARFRVSKSTVHKDITEKLKHVNPALHREAARILEYNKSLRHIRGGEATRRKYLASHVEEGIESKAADEVAV
jgi:putative DeoR family transcriptional regulator (stage III sporulation protein D)